MRKTVIIINRLVYKTLDRYEYIINMLSLSQTLILLMYVAAIVVPLMMISYYETLGYMCDGLVIVLDIIFITVFVIWYALKLLFGRLIRRLRAL